MMENNDFFKRKLEHIKRESKKKDILVIFILLLYITLYMQETKNSNLFDKNCTQEKHQENVIP